jgi:predicted TIM-barrel fold metal-dependent hydrolase
MIPNGVKKAVIIQVCRFPDIDLPFCIILVLLQPINHKFDHRFLIETLEGADRNFFKGVCLLDPTQPIETGCDFLENMRARGFVGVRFNPGLWLGTESMSDTRGLSFFRKAGELNLSVGFMCFKGLHLHIEEIKTLLDNSPQTKVVIDHMGFCYQKNEWNTIAWNSLLDLSHYPQVYVKISAFFRNSGQRFPFLDLDSRLVDLVSAYGSSRLLFGTDYPFVKQIEGGYEEVSNAMSYWPASQSFLNEKDWGNLYRDTAMDLYEITD